MNVLLKVLFLVLGLCCAASAQTSWAEPGYPSRPIRVVVPFAAGASTDSVARIISEALGKRLNQSIVVENLTGAAGSLAADQVAKAKPDGYTLLLTTNEFTMNPTLRTNLPYDTWRDFAPVSGFAYQAMFLAASESLKADSLKELIEIARSKPGTLNYASWGVGSSGHLAVELFAKVAEVKVTHIPYKGLAPALSDLLAGRVDFAFVSIASSAGYFEAKKLKPLAVSSLKRSKQLSNVPTFDEAGFAGYEALNHFGFVAPAGTDPAIIKRLADEVRSLVLQEGGELQARLISMGFTPQANASPDEYRAFLRREAEKWATAIKAADLKPTE